MHNVNGWTKFFNNQFFNLFDRSFILKELITQIRCAVNPPATILEVGCGSGITSVLLASMGYQITAVDANVQLVMERVKKFETAFPNLTSMQVDMFRMYFDDKTFDIAFSQGVLEHYSNKNIVRALFEQKRVARIVIIDVPNGRGKIGDYGDERLISPIRWRKLIRAAGLTVVNKSTRGMSRWSESFPKLLGWIEDSWISRRFGENSIFVCKEV